MKMAMAMTRLRGDSPGREGACRVALKDELAQRLSLAARIKANL
jgi:hypothetical protein